MCLLIDSVSIINSHQLRSGNYRISILNRRESVHLTSSSHNRTRCNLFGVICTRQLQPHHHPSSLRSHALNSQDTFALRCRAKSQDLLSALSDQVARFLFIRSLACDTFPVLVQSSLISLHCPSRFRMCVPPFRFPCDNLRDSQKDSSCFFGIMPVYQGRRKSKILQVCAHFLIMVA